MSAGVITPGSSALYGCKGRVLDLFCGGGGAGSGYVYAGYEVVGVDIAPQKDYPFTFILDNALTYMEGLISSGEIRRFDLLHASPPCQAHMKSGNINGYHYEDLIPETRELLKASGLPYIIENVPGAPLISPIRLCGKNFGLMTYRHRLFESNIPFKQPYHLLHREVRTKLGIAPNEGEMIDVAGNFIGVDYARRAMRINWMPRKTLKEAIPPAYTHYLGLQARRILGA